MDNNLNEYVRVLADYVLVRQTIVKKEGKIITDASKDDRDKFDYSFEIAQKGSECKRDFQIGEAPIFSEYVKFSSVRQVEKTTHHMINLVIVHENDIIGIDLQPMKLEIPKTLPNSAN